MSEPERRALIAHLAGIRGARGIATREGPASRLLEGEAGYGPWIRGLMLLRQVIATVTDGERTTRN